MNNKGTDQPVHPRSLISAFVIHFLESSLAVLAISEIFNFLASLCRLAGWFESHFVGNPEDRFCGRVPTSSGNHGKPGKPLKKVSCMEKSWNLKKI